MTSAISPVFPRSIARAKRIAKQLHEIYPHHNLSKCQAVTAHLFFQPDWHTLNASLKLESSSGVFDHELSESDFKKRRKAQRAIVCKELGGVDIETEFSIPDDPDYANDPNALVLQAVWGSASPHAMKRLEMAVNRYQQRLAGDVIFEIGPTLVKNNPQTPITIPLTFFNSEWLSRLPQLLARWWRINIPHQPIVADTLNSYTLDTNRLTSILRFGGYWGELCMHYSSIIDWTMAMGTAYLLAERYGTILVHAEPSINELSTKLRNCSREEYTKLTFPYFTKRIEFSGIFLGAYPRDDFQDVFQSQPKAFKENADKCFKILNDPYSKKGTWDN